MKPVLSVGVLAVAVACGGSERITEHFEPPVICVTPVTVSPASANLLQGDSLRLTASLGGCNGTPPAAAWSSSNPAVASVDATTGVVHALTRGVTTIIAAAVLDPTVKGAALINVSIGDVPPITIQTVSYVSSNGTVTPVKLDSLVGVIQIEASASSTTGATQTAELVVAKGGGDTVVATSTSPSPAPQNYKHSFRWNTDARDAAGSRVFPNGPALLRVRLHESTSSTVYNTSLVQGTLKNP